jgi:hypothetical protein
MEINVIAKYTIIIEVEVVFQFCKGVLQNENCFIFIKV